MITRIIYNRVPNNSNGSMGVAIRTVGEPCQVDHRWSVVTAIDLEEMKMDKVKVYNFRVYYECGVEHVIPYNHDIEYYEENETDNEGAVKQD